MNGDLMYEMAKQQMAERHRLAEQRQIARQARKSRATARGRRVLDEVPEAVVMPVIPDFADEMFDAARKAVPAPRPEAGRGRHARSSH